MADLLLKELRSMTAEERIEAIANVAMKDKGHLKKWLRSTNRVWLVFNSLELVDALRWPEGVDVLMQIIACYRDHRRAVPTGEVEMQLDPSTGESTEIPLYKREGLEVGELDAAIRDLVRQIKDEVPTWTLNDPPM